MKKICLLVAAVFYIASPSLAVAQDRVSCSAENAVDIARSNFSVIKFCSKDQTDKKNVCDYKARKSSPLPSSTGEKNDAGTGWLVTASTHEGSIFIKLSAGCGLVEQPIYVKTINVGTLELGVLESKDIVIGKVIDVQSPEPVHVGGGTKIQTETLTVAVSKVLKGEQVPKVTFYEGFVIPEYSAKKLWLNNGHDMLFLISRGRLIGMPDDESCKGKSGNMVGSEADKNKAFMSCAASVVTDSNAPDEGKPILYGGWPSAIDLETIENSSGALHHPIFSKTGDILKTKDAVLSAVQSELAREAQHSPEAGTLKDSLDNKAELSLDKYQQAYDAGIPMNRLIVLEVPKE